MTILKNLDQHQIETARPLTKYELRRIEKEKAIPVSFLHECFEPDYEAGTLTWKTRPLEHFKTERDRKTWNTRYAGKPALNCNSQGYLNGKLTISGKVYLLRQHRILWAMHAGEWPSDQIDHINGNKLDNCISNLRVVTNQENSRNRKRNRNNTTGVTGVYFNKQNGKWVATIFVDGKLICLRCADTGKAHFEHKIDAIYARYYAEQDFGYHENHGRG